MIFCAWRICCDCKNCCYDLLWSICGFAVVICLKDLWVGYCGEGYVVFLLCWRICHLYWLQKIIEKWKEKKNTKTLRKHLPNIFSYSQNIRKRFGLSFSKTLRAYLIHYKRHCNGIVIPKQLFGYVFSIRNSYS